MYNINNVYIKLLLNEKVSEQKNTSIALKCTNLCDVYANLKGLPTKTNLNIPLQ